MALLGALAEQPFVMCDGRYATGDIFDYTRVTAEAWRRMAASCAPDSLSQFSLTTHIVRLVLTPKARSAPGTSRGSATERAPSARRDWPNTAPRAQFRRQART
jgi:hypothetical protein